MLSKREISMKKNAFVLFTCFSVMLAACGGASQPSAVTSTPTDPTSESSGATGITVEDDIISLRIAQIASGQGGYVMRVAEEFGLAEKHGLDLQVFEMGFTEAGNALQLGRVDVGIIQPSTALNLRRSGFDVQMVAPVLWSGNFFVVKADSPYETLEDLVGKRIGNFSQVTGAYFFSQVMARAKGLDIEEDFEQAIAATGALIALLERGDVEAINMFEPFVSRMLSSGEYRAPIDFDAEFEELFGTRPIKNTVGAQRQFIEENPEAIRRIQLVLRDAIDIILAGEDEVFFRQVGRDFFGLQDEAQLNAGFARNRLSYVDSRSWSDEMTDGQNAILQSGIDLGLLPNAPFWEDVFAPIPSGGPSD